MSRHANRRQLGREFSAIEIVTEPGDEGVGIKEMTRGLGAHSVIEAVGTQEGMMQAVRATRRGGHVGYVGVSHEVELPGGELVFDRTLTLAEVAEGYRARESTEAGIFAGLGTCTAHPSRGAQSSWT